jgi:hypothetical protein
MIYITYILLVPISLLLEFVIARPLSVVLALFATQKMGWCDNHSYWGVGPRLPTWLNWFQTPDNSLDGDATFLLNNGYGYWSQVKWLWRNPAYSFALRHVQVPYETSVKGDKTIKDNDNAKEGWCLVHANGLFQITFVKRIFSSSRCIYVNLGWNIRGLVDDNIPIKPDVYQATFVFSPRISGFR